MTVDDAINVLAEISEAGEGHLPLQIMETQQGMTYAVDVRIIRAMEYDGDRVLIYGTNKSSPEWSKEKVKLSPKGE